MCQMGICSFLPPRDRITAGVKLEEKLEDFFARRKGGIKPGLEVVQALLAVLGEPQNHFLSVHVAGTNGKGSTCACLESIFRAAGIRTGLFTSPHLVRYNERIQIDGEPIEDETLVERINRIEAADQQTGLRPASFFELSTALAFEAFREAGVQIAIIETGLGGRWDATNVLSPLVSVITRIDLDHMHWLGDTIEAIAAEKCGIIKSGRPVVFGPQQAAAERVIRETAAGKRSPCIEAAERVVIQRKRQDVTGQKLLIESNNQDFGTVNFSLIGDHQLENLLPVVGTAEVVFDALQIQMDPAWLKQGLKRVAWPGRFDVIQENPPAVLDGAHNPSAIRGLLKSLRQVFPRQPMGFVLSFLSDKSTLSMFDLVQSEATRIWLSPVSGTVRTCSVEDLESLTEETEVQSQVLPLPEALEAGMVWARETGGVLCITGSLYLVGNVMKENEFRFPMTLRSTKNSRH